MKKIVPFLAAAAAALFAFSGCAALEGQDPATDDGIAALANSRLNDDAMTARATLSVEVDNGLAVLHGTVPSEAARQRAIQLLEATPGIYEVLDRTRLR